MEAAEPPDAAANETSITIVRIKRRRDEPAAPEIIIEATGARRQKQARVDEVLAQLQGLSVALSTSSEAVTAPSDRRRFRKLHTVEASTIMRMTEEELLRLVHGGPVGQQPQQQDAAQPPATAPPDALTTTTATDPAAAAAAAPQVTVTAAAPELLASPLMSLGAQPCPPPTAAHPLQRRDVKGAGGPTQASARAALRESHRQASVAARYKQIRRLRVATASGARGSAVRMYDLETAAAAEAAAVAARRAVAADGVAAAGVGAAAGGGSAARGQVPTASPGAGSGTGTQRAVDGEGTGARTAATAAVAGMGTTAAKPGQQGPSLDPYQQLITEYLGQQLGGAGPVRPQRIPARRRKQSEQQQQQQPPDTALREPEPSAAATLPPGAAGEAGSCTAAGGGGAAADVHAAGEGCSATERHGEEHGDFVYDVYVQVQEGGRGQQIGGEGVGAGQGPEGGDGGLEELWPWVDGACSPEDLAVPVIEVAEDDEDKLQPDGGEVPPGLGALELGPDHDSEDSNAESYYANSYPDEDLHAAFDNAYGEAYDDDDVDDDVSSGVREDPREGLYGWGAFAGVDVRRPDPMSDEEDGDEEEDGEGFGGRGVGKGKGSTGGGRAKPSAYYRTEDDDYSEHSSYMSEEEERREAEERRRRGIFMH